MSIPSEHLVKMFAQRNSASARVQAGVNPLKENASGGIWEASTVMYLNDMTSAQKGIGGGVIFGSRQGVPLQGDKSQEEAIPRRRKKYIFLVTR
jgi:hypothetical protein